MGLFDKKAVETRQNKRIGSGTRNDFLRDGRYRVRVHRYIISESGHDDKKGLVNEIKELEIISVLYKRAGSYTNKDGALVKWESNEAGSVAAVINQYNPGSSAYADQYALQRIVDFGAFVLQNPDFDTEALEALGGPDNPLKGFEFTLDVQTRKSQKNKYYTAYDYSDPNYDATAE